MGRHLTSEHLAEYTHAHAHAHVHTHTSTPLSLPILQEMSSSESCKMSVIGWGWDGNTPVTAEEDMAELIRELLQVISCEVVIIAEYVVVAWPARTLEEDPN